MKIVRDLLSLGVPELDDEAFQFRGRNAGMRFYGKGGGGSAPSADPAIGQAALQNVELGKQWLDFAKEQFAEGNERQDVTDALNTKVINQQLDTQDQANTWAQEDRARTKNVFQPVEDQFIETAKNYDTQEKQAEAAAAAKADVQSAAAVQQQASERNMASIGVSPMSGRFAGIQRSTDLNTALASADAQNKARTLIKDKGLALKADAINMGKGLASSTAAAYGIGTNAGNSAVANNASGNANFYANQGVMGQGYNGAIGANSSSANILNNLYGNQLSAWSAKQQANATSAAGMGQMVGTMGAMAMMSDERLKTNIQKVGQLDNGLALYTYEFKDEFKDEFGHGKQFGVMAQEVEKVLPDAIIERPDGYKMVDYSKVLNHVV